MSEGNGLNSILDSDWTLPLVEGEDLQLQKRMIEQRLQKGLNVDSAVSMNAMIDGEKRNFIFVTFQMAHDSLVRQVVSLKPLSEVRDWSQDVGTLLKNGYSVESMMVLTGSFVHYVMVLKSRHNPRSE